MKKMLLFLTIFMVASVFSVSAADIIVLKDGSMIDVKIMEIYPGEIRYKRADNLNGPMITLPKDRVMSIRHESGAVEIVNAPSSAVPPSAGQASGQTGVAGSSGGQQPGAQAPVAQAPVTQTSVAQAPVVQTLLQTSLLNTLNGLPAIKIAGNNLKFQFNGANWTAMLNGESFSTGSIEVEDTDGGAILNLKQTHIWPGAVAGKVAGKLASKVPGGAVAGSALNAAGGLAGAVEASGPVIILEYKAGPPAKLSYLKSAKVGAGGSLDSEFIVLADGQWEAGVLASNPSLQKTAVAQFNIANEQIDGGEREVLTLETKLAVTLGSEWKRGHFILNNQTMVQQLREGSGVRFKVLGDGKQWTLQIPTEEGIRSDWWFEAPIATKRGKVVQVDIPYSKLKPLGNGKKVPFIKESITTLALFKHGTKESGSSTIKVFDFEIY